MKNFQHFFSKISLKFKINLLMKNIFFEENSCGGHKTSSDRHSKSKVQSEALGLVIAGHYQVHYEGLGKKRKVKAISLRAMFLQIREIVVALA
jgi:hypothetical protein